MAVRDSTVNELTALCGKRFADKANKKGWNQLVSEAIRGKGISYGPDVTELKSRIHRTGAAHSASKSKADAAAREHTRFPKRVAS